ncbi:MAG: hypothetical protein JWM16_3522 [Verrucomicrobiales bacterium]|nr:hypothetical protein [Verrucomicrobiales bacterium]
MTSRIGKALLCVLAICLVECGGVVLGASFNEPGVSGQLSLIRSNNGVVRITYQGQTNFQYIIQASSNLVNWSAISTNVVSSGPISFLDNPATNLPRRFYSATTLKTPMFYYGTTTGNEAGKFLLMIRTNNVGTLFALNTARNRGERMLTMPFDSDGRFCGPLFASASGCLQVSATNVTGTYTNTSNQTGSISGTNRYNFGGFRNAAGLYTAAFSGAGVCPGTVQALVSADGAMFFYVASTSGAYTDAAVAQAMSGNGSFGDPNPPANSIHITGSLSANSATISGSYIHACPDRAGAGALSMSRPEKVF